ncbi:MAG: hypothetical protein JWO41_825 [Candidatus Saccharibacteria bacterium]|nr:hypothetical protein [Candidatus Saccharibacteria bacterium]
MFRQLRCKENLYCALITLIIAVGIDAFIHFTWGIMHTGSLIAFAVVTVFSYIIIWSYLTDFAEANYRIWRESRSTTKQSLNRTTTKY